MNDYDRLEQAQLAVKQARDRFDLIPLNDEDLLDSAIYQLKSAELSLNMIYKELKANKSVIN